MDSELFDHSIEKYVIKWENIAPSFKLGVTIQKKDETKIGKIKTEGLIRKKTLLLDIDDSIVLTIYKSVITAEKYEIKDSEGSSIGIVEGVFSIWAIDVFMKNSKGEKILTVKRLGDSGPYPGIDSNFESITYTNRIYEINAMDGENIAKFEIKHEIIKQGGHVDHNSICNLQINNLDFDRKSLIGLFVSVLSGFSDFGTGGGGWDWSAGGGI